MDRINDNNYYQVSGWMLNRLKLKGSELHVFAIIYGFTQDGESEFTGSCGYLSDWLGVTRQTILTALSSLTEKGFLIKTKEVRNKSTYVMYKSNKQLIDDMCQGGKEILQGGVKNFDRGCKEILHGGCQKTLHNNNILNNNIDNNNIYTPKNDFSAEFDSLWSLYPKKKGKSAVSKKAIKELQKAGFETVKKAIECYKEEIRKNHTEEQYIMNGSTFFNGRWQDYLTDSEVIADNGYGNIGTIL